MNNEKTENKPNDGGSAFPCRKLTHYESDMNGAPVPVYDAIGGVTKREYYAVKALQGMLSNSFKELLDAAQTQKNQVIEVTAQMAFIYADAMIKAGAE